MDPPHFSIAVRLICTPSVQHGSVVAYQQVALFPAEPETGAPIVDTSIDHINEHSILVL